jgi:hypothetical protein
VVLLVAGDLLVVARRVLERSEPTWPQCRDRLHLTPARRGNHGRGTDETSEEERA